MAYSRANDLTVLVCPVNMHGLTGASQVIGALLHGVCTVHTSHKTSSEARVEGTFEAGKKSVQASTTAFRDAMEPHLAQSLYASLNAAITNHEGSGWS